MRMASAKLSTIGTRGRCRGGDGVETWGGAREMFNAVMPMVLPPLKFPAVCRDDSGASCRTAPTTSRSDDAQCLGFGQNTPPVPPGFAICLLGPAEAPLPVDGALLQ